MRYGIDQASGLRQILRQPPPEVLAVLPCGASAMRWLAMQAHQRAVLGVRILAFDEWMITGSFSDCVGAVPTFDLLQAALGHVSLVSCRAEALPELAVVSTARLAREMCHDRLLLQRCAAQLEHFKSQSDEWLIIARPCELAGLSAFALAAPRLLLVLEATDQAFAQGYSTLKELAEGADTLAVGVALAGPQAPAARQRVSSFQKRVHQSLNVTLHGVASVGEAIGLSVGSNEPLAYAERLLLRARQVRVAEAR